MSWEAWGSDEPPNRWEETQAREDYDALIAKWEDWHKNHADMLDATFVNAVTEALEKLGELMEGPL